MVDYNSNGRDNEYSNISIAKQTVNDHPVAKLIKIKAIELRGAGPDSELLIISEKLQVNEGLITDPNEIDRINANFEALSQYKQEVVLNHRTYLEANNNL